MKRRLAVLLTLALVPVIAACGSKSSSSSDSGGTSQALLDHAAQVVAESSKPVTTYDFPTSAPKPARNKHIVAITCTNQGSGCPQSAQGTANATKALGWKVDIVDGKGNPSVWNSAMRNAIASHVDGIVLSAVPPKILGDAIQKANAAHIPVVTIFEPFNKTDGVYGHVTVDNKDMGRRLADWVIADSKGKAHVVVNTDNEYQELDDRVAGFKAELAKCSSCKVVATVPSTLASLATDLPHATIAAVQAHPDANYVVANTDNHAVFITQGLRQAGKLGPIKVASYDGNTPNYDLIRQGQQSVVQAEPYEFYGWLAADLLIRAFAGEPGQDHLSPSRMLVKDNIGSSGMWNLDFDWKGQFEKLWGIG
jgi:ribose transport system substrate-binding protein